MDFKKKLKIRFILAIVYIIVGITFAAFYYCKVTDNQFLHSFGIAFIALGIANIIKYKRITKDDESIHRREVAETDERNIAIAKKAQSSAFVFCTLTGAIAVIVLEVLGKTDYATIISLPFFALLTSYFVLYWIYQKRG
ncbi:MAG: DUF2178 domain-containing protein [Clostridia bacterium]|nr:DUF2178 domain-containing protein [Clostridia bacterium]